MGNYNLVHIESKKTFFNLTRLEMVNKLKPSKDLQNWFCWYPGLTDWKRVSQSLEIKEWIANTWTETQSMPPWQNLFSKKSGNENTTNDFEVVEYTESQTLNPPPVPENAEFVISGFSGQVYDFDESTKSKTEISKDSDKAVSEKTVKVDISSVDFEKTSLSNTQSKFDNTVAVNNSGSDFDKTRSSTTALTTENTAKITPTAETTFDQTDKVAIKPMPENTHKISSNIPNVKKSNDVPVHDDSSLEAKVKKHNRRYPRIKGRLRTIITNKSKAFMTFTKDISLGGIQVENMIPQDILNTEIEVYLSDPTGKKSILFRCHPVGDTNNPCRFSFAKADEKNIQKLTQWLDDLAKVA